jgi:hypothetical protein
MTLASLKHLDLCRFVPFLQGVSRVREGLPAYLATLFLVAQSGHT